MKKVELLDEELAVVESALIYLYGKIEKNNQAISRINRQTRYKGELITEGNESTIQTLEKENTAIRGAMHGIRSLTQKTKLL